MRDTNAGVHMKAFFSHSSKDKAYVNAVAEKVGGANVELDADTFEYGLTNTQAILNALNKCELFVLFVSKNSVQSKIVQYESKIAEDLLARGAIERMLFICIDEESFSLAHAEWKKYNFVRYEPSPKVAARLIQSTMMGVRARRVDIQQPFVGRAAELDAAKERVIDPEMDQPKAIFVSGNNGIGRRTFVKQLYNDLYPAVSKIIPEIPLEAYDSIDEIFRKVWSHVEPETTIGDLTASIQHFSSLDNDGKIEKVADLIGRVQASRETLILRDHGGLMQESGELQPALSAVIGLLKSYPHPGLVLVAERTPPKGARSSEVGIIYCPLNSLSETSVRQLIALKLQQKQIQYSSEQLSQLVDLSDRHPFNVNYIMECVDAYGLPVFLADPSSLTTWKNRRTSEFINSISTTQSESRLLAILKHFPALDFSVIVEAMNTSLDDVGNAVSSLIDKHIVERGSGSYFVAPPLKGAIDRSPRFRLSDADLKVAMRAIGDTLVSVEAGSTVPVSMVESGILAMLQTDTPLPEHVEVFLLPSHLIWLARRRYDERNFPASIKLAREALKSRSRLSVPGQVEACRLICLSAARLNEPSDFSDGMDILKSLPRDPFVQSMIEFLNGFAARLDGRLLEAESYQRESFKNRPGNFHAARELAFLCLTRDNMVDAEFFARKAFEKAPDNAYILDILTSILIRNVKIDRRNLVELEELLERLKLAGKDTGKTFYETRAAEYALQNNQKSEAAKIIDEAIHRTPHIFDVRAVRAKVYAAIGNRAVVSDEIGKMQSLVQRSAKEGRTNLRKLQEIRSEYYVLISDFKEARRMYDLGDVFSEAEKRDAVRRIDLAEAYTKGRPR